MFLYSFLIRAPNANIHGCNNCYGFNVGNGELGAFDRPGRSCSHIFHTPGTKPKHCAKYPFCGSAIADNTDNPSEEWPIKHTSTDIHYHRNKMTALYEYHMPVPPIVHNLLGSSYTPNGFHKLT